MKSLLGNTRYADLVFYSTGHIYISVRVAQVLALNVGDAIDILNDKGEFLLCVRNRAPLIGRHEGVLARSKQGSHHLRTYSRKLCNAMFVACGASDDAKSAKLCVGEKTTLPQIGDALPIITKMIIQ